MEVNRRIVNSAFKLQPRHVYQKLWLISRWVEIKETLKKVASSELKHLFTIHLFTFFFYSLKKIKGEVQGTSMKRVTNTPSCMVAIRQNKGYQLKSDAFWK
jgi:hypothetical protein